MIFKKNNLSIFCLVILLGLGAYSSPTWAQSNSHLRLDATRVSWTDISFHAKNFWVEVSTDIHLRSLRASDLDAVLLASPKGTPIKPQTPQAAEMTITTTIDPSFRSPVNIHNKIWFNPKDAAALGRVRLRSGRDHFKKMYRFTDQGVFRHRIEPQNKKEASLEPGRWTDIKDSFYPYDLTRLGCPFVSERSLLIFILAAVDYSKDNEPLSLCVFGKRQLHPVQLQKLGINTVKVNYVEKIRQTKNQKVKTIKALKIGITVEPMASDRKKTENFSFLGFHKNISVFIDPATHLPVKASGIIPMVGKADLRLQEVILK
jgi:hypothetical protein